MNIIREESPISRASLSNRTGLTKATVSSLVSELIQRQFIREIGLEANALGRPSIKLTLNPAAGYIISSEIGVDFITVIGTDFSPKIIYRSDQKIDPSMGADNILNELLTHINNANKSCVSQLGDNLLGLALGVPGLVDYNTGELLFAPNLGWENFPLRSVLTEQFNKTYVFVDNEANMGTLGEYYFGAAHQYRDVLYLSAGVGLGGGILRDGRLLRGVAGFAGEFGHITLDPDGELCGCGNRGCWETQVSQKALFRYVIQDISGGKPSMLDELTKGNLEQLSVVMVVNAARSGDQVALRALEKVGHHLGIGIASMINALNPEMVVFGGILSIGWEYMWPAVDEELHNRALHWNREAARVVLARHGINACVMGGVAMVYEAILSQPNSPQTSL